ncbi:MAG: TIGR01620 family protein [Pseudomonadota bacterium]
MSDPKRRGPRLIEDGLDALPPAPAGAAEAPAIDAPPAEASAAAATRIVAAKRGSLLVRLFWSSLLGLLSLGLGLWFWETVEALLARNVWLGRAALALAILFGTTLMIIALREMASLSRLKRIDGLRDGIVRAHATRDQGAAEVALHGVEALYRSRAELSDARTTLAAQRADIVDGDALIDLAERTLMTPLDREGAAAVRRGARDVAAATALIPLALVDVLAVLAINLRMIRQIAEIYGGRAGWLGSWRLLRAIASHLVAAGAIAVGDDLLGPALGGGILSKVSRRFGEGMINGALTARIGVAAMDVCRPMPFHKRKRPNITTLIRGALGDHVATAK